jgi:hypothetical protein
MDFSKLTPEQFKVAELVIEAAEANKIDPNLLLAQAFRESGFRHIPNKETDAFGVMQIRPSTAEQNKLGDITDLRTNIFGGAKLMRQYLDKYKSPEAALLAYHQGPGVADTYIKSGGDLKAVGPKGLDYVINIGENGGFGQPAKAQVDEDAPKNENPFANYESESSKFKREQDEAKRNAPPKPNPEDEQGGIGAPEAGAVAGSIANILFPPMTSPERAVKMDTGKAEEANLSAQDKLELARRNLSDIAPQGTADIEDAYRQSQSEIERLKNEQRLAQERLKTLPKAPPAMEMPAPSSPFPQETREGRASGPKVEGDSGTRNWMIQEAGQKHQLPEAVLDLATGKTKDSPTGGKALIDQDLANLEKIKQLGAGDYGLVTTEGGVQLQLPPTTVAERQADIDRQNKESQAELAERTEQARIQQEAQAQKLEQQRLAYEADLERLRQERAQAGQQLNEVTGQKRTVAPLQRALTKAENDAEIAKRKLQRAQQQPNATGRTLQNVGAGSAKIGALPRAGVGAGAGYLGVMSYQEALERYKAGDTSEAVLKALEAGAATAAVVPPAGKKLTKVRGAGVLGGLGLGTYELGRRLLKDAPPEE